MSCERPSTLRRQTGQCMWALRGWCGPVAADVAPGGEPLNVDAAFVDVVGAGAVVVGEAGGGGGPRIGVVVGVG
jgi:hypothetical protein